MNLTGARTKRGGMWFNREATAEENLTLAFGHAEKLSRDGIGAFRELKTQVLHGCRQLRVVKAMFGLSPVNEAQKTPCP